jgi:hypothetical protein
MPAAADPVAARATGVGRVRPGSGPVRIDFKTATTALSADSSGRWQALTTFIVLMGVFSFLFASKATYRLDLIVGLFSGISSPGTAA